VNNVTLVVFHDGVAARNVTVHLIPTPDVAEYPDRAVDVVLGAPSGANAPRVMPTSPRSPSPAATRIIIRDPRPRAGWGGPGGAPPTAPSTFLPPSATGLVEEAQLIVTTEGVVVGSDTCTPISVRTAAALGLTTVPVTLWRDAPFTQPAAITFNMTAPSPAGLPPALASAGAVPATLAGGWVQLTAVFAPNSPNATLAIPIPPAAAALSHPSIATVSWVRSDNVAPPAAGSLAPLTLCFVPNVAVAPPQPPPPAPSAMMPGAVAGLVVLAVAAMSTGLWALARRRLRRSPRNLREAWRAVTTPRGKLARGPFSGADGAQVHLKPGVDPTQVIPQWRLSSAGLEGDAAGGGGADGFVHDSPLQVQRSRGGGDAAGGLRKAFGPEATPGSQRVLRTKEVHVQPRPAAPVAAFVGGGSTVSHIDNPLLLQRKAGADSGGARATPPHARGGVMGWFHHGIPKGSAAGGGSGGGGESALMRALSRHNTDLNPLPAAVGRAPSPPMSAVPVAGAAASRSGELMHNPLWTRTPSDGAASVPPLRLPARDSDPRAFPASQSTVDVESGRLSGVASSPRGVSPSAAAAMTAAAAVRKAPVLGGGGGGESVATAYTASAALVGGAGAGGGGGGGTVFGAAAALLARTASGVRLTARPKSGGR
jgi:hypothetical protein